LADGMQRRPLRIYFFETDAAWLSGANNALMQLEMMLDPLLITASLLQG